MRIAQPTIFFVPNLTPADVTERLEQFNPALAREARKILDVNKSERHIRGGMATREKYLHQAHPYLHQEKNGIQ